jgi:hypothetical protein
VVVAILLAGLFYILYDFRTNQTYGLLFYLIASSLLTVVLLLLLVKMMAGYRFITAGKGKLEVRLPLRALKKIYKMAQVKIWQEEIIMANKKEFRQLTIVFDDNTSFSLSNHEHTSYIELLNYFQKKAGKKKIK